MNKIISLSRHWPWIVAISAFIAGCSEDSIENTSISCEPGLELCGHGCCANTCCDGVCVDTANDKENCGTCGNACDPGKICSQNNCLSAEEQCSANQDWCNGQCVNLSSDPKHCGNCTTKCAAGEACVSGSCNSSGCAKDYTVIDGVCRNPQIDSEYCGNPPIHCGANMYCGKGECKCQAGYYDCNNDKADGCESQAICGGGGQVVTCQAPRMECGNECIDVRINENHCGDCETVCNPEETCKNGTCEPNETPAPECEPGLEACFGKCVDFTTDSTNCGRCLNTCGADEKCDNGTCVLDCKDLITCGNACFDPNNSAAHCGNCGTSCKDGEACVGGSCQCADGHYDCDGNAANGCESTTKCPCKPNDKRACWRGDASAKFKSSDNPKTICEKGSQTCDASGQFWGPCTGGTYPTAVTCDIAGNLNGLDNDCDGTVDTECRSECDLRAGEMSYIGCEYWGAYIDNLITDKYSNHTFVLSNPNEKAANVYIYNKAQAANSSAAPVKTQTIAPHNVIAIEMHNRGYNMSKGTGILQNAYRIRSDLPITAYQFSPLGNPEAHSNDASLLLPANVLGKKYLGMTWQSEPGTGEEGKENDHRSYISIIATEPGNTDVLFTTSSEIVGTENTTIKYSESQNVTQTSVELMHKGATRRFTLKRFEVLTLMAPSSTDHNQTGSIITADKKIAVFGASRSTFVPAGVKCCRDHIEEQLIPTQAWGKSYHAARAYSGGKAGDFWLITARDNNTTVKLTKGLKNLNNNKDIPETIKLNAGETYGAFETRTPFEIKADKPISVGQFLPSQDYNDYKNPKDPSSKIGDPSFILTVPYEQYRSSYDFMVPEKFDTHYLTIIAPKDATIQYDGKTITNYIGTREQIGSSNFYVGYFEVLPGVHHMTSNKPFGLYSYGYYFMSSYGYPIGLDLKILNTN